MEANNMKAMREAVRSLMDNLKIHLLQPIDQITINRAELEAMVKDCSEALAAPARNCDLYVDDGAISQFEQDTLGKIATTFGERDKNMKENWILYNRWLFHKSDNTKGATDGSK